jgi:FkbM family methyltransferase
MRHPPPSAGANAGFSAVLFKLAWPGATVVALEPDSGNFEALERQVAGLEGVQPLRGALWGRRARVAQVGQHEGDWGRVFEALDPGAPAPPGGALSIDAYSVSDVAALAGVPAFDFVKIDIEGAEGRVFDPEAGTDVAWLPAARVISLEVHDYFAGYFGLQVGKSGGGGVWRGQCSSLERTAAGRSPARARRLEFHSNAAP